MKMQKYSNQLWELRQGDVKLKFRCLWGAGLEISMSRKVKVGSEGALTLRTKPDAFKNFREFPITLRDVRCKLEIVPHPSGSVRLVASRNSEIVDFDLMSEEAVVLDAFISSNSGFMSGILPESVSLPTNLSPGRIFLEPQ